MARYIIPFKLKGRFVEIVAQYDMKSKKPHPLLT